MVGKRGFSIADATAIKGARDRRLLELLFVVVTAGGHAPE
jgi:hypothetical protein